MVVCTCHPQWHRYTRVQMESHTEITGWTTVPNERRIVAVAPLAIGVFARSLESIHPSAFLFFFSGRPVVLHHGHCVVAFLERITDQATRTRLSTAVESIKVENDSVWCQPFLLVLFH